MSRRPLRIESLERRMLMAGDVSVLIRSGDLVITGDVNLGDVAESIRIEHDGTNYSVTGLSGTTINGAGSPFQSAAVTRDIIVDLRTGNDSVEVKGLAVENRLRVPRNLTVRGGTGDDTIRVENVEVVGVLNVDGAAGANTIDVKGSRLTRDAVLRGGADTDTITIDQSQFLGKLTVDPLAGTNTIDVKNSSSVAKDALIRGGINVDSIAVDGSSFSGKLTVDGLAGENTIAVRGGSAVARDVLLKGGVEDDVITVESSGFSGKLTIDSGAGLDDLTIKDSDVTRDVSVKSLSGNTEVSIERVTARAKLSVVTGGGRDEVRILSSSVTGALSVSTGGEADDVGLNSVNVASNITINAGLNLGSVVKVGGVDTVIDGDPDRVGIVGGEAVNLTVDMGDSGSKDRAAGIGEVGITGTKINGNLTIKTGHNGDLIGVGNDPDLLVEMDELINEVAGATTGAVSVGNVASIVSGMGFDRLRVHSVTAKVFKLDAGLGGDTARINNVAVAPNTPKSQLSIKMGNGVDRLTLTNTLVSSFASKLVDGGSEEDTLVTDGINASPADHITANNTVFKNWDIWELYVPE